MTSANEKTVRLFREAIPALVQIVASGRARSARIRFTAVDRPSFNNFWWIEVDKLDGDEGPKLWARTNDIDLMVGYPPSFHKSVALDQSDELVQAACAFLEEKLGTSTRVEILLQGDAAQGQEYIPNHVGNSDEGFENITEQRVNDIC